MEIYSSIPGQMSCHERDRGVDLWKTVRIEFPCASTLHRDCERDKFSTSEVRAGEYRLEDHRDKVLVDIQDIPLRADGGIELNVSPAQSLGIFTASVQNTRYISIRPAWSGMPTRVHETHRYNVPILYDVLDGPEDVLIPMSRKTLPDIELLPRQFPPFETLQKLVTVDARHEQVLHAIAHGSEVVL